MKFSGFHQGRRGAGGGTQGQRGPRAQGLGDEARASPKRGVLRAWQTQNGGERGENRAGQAIGAWGAGKRGLAIGAEDQALAGRAAKLHLQPRACMQTGGQGKGEPRHQKEREEKPGKGKGP